MVSFVVGTNDFRAGLRAVLPHAEKLGKWLEYHRVRLDIGPENLTLTATDRFTTALAIVSVHTHLDPELGAIDLTPADCSSILAEFKAGTDKEGDTEFILHIETTETHVVVTDSSGLIPGRALKMLRQPVEENFPDVALVLSKAHHAPPTTLEDMPIGGPLLGRFRDASAAYKQPLILEANQGWRSLFIRCGESFLGSASPSHVDREDVKRWADDWNERLPDPNAEQDNEA